jgi:hypothetical protein
MTLSAKKRRLLDAVRLREVLHYDPVSGVFTWKVNTARLKLVGKRAGYVGPDGYRVIRIYTTSFAAGCLAWLFMTGKWPTEEVDHKNLIKSDDSWHNLREATKANNIHNRRFKGKYKGTRKTANGRWQAMVYFSGRYYYFGTHKKRIDAARAYDSGAIKLFGKFARPNFERSDHAHC